MQTRRDQVQAHLFVVGRLNASILRSDMDSPQTPLSRTGKGVLIGLVLALVATAGVAVFGLLRPKSQQWRSGKDIVAVKQTGARFLYLSGALHPLLNYASAALLLGDSTVSLVQVDSDQLTGVPRGSAVGIPGAPDAVPAAADLPTASTWQVCAVNVTDDQDTHRRTALAVDAAHTPDLIADSRGVLVGADSRNFLLWRGRRYRLPDERAALAALGYDGAPVRPVSAAFLSAVPSGPRLAAPPVPHAGAGGPRLAGRHTRVGQLFRLGSTDEHYLLRAGGLVPVTRTVYDLLRADRDVMSAAYPSGVAVRTLAPTDLRGRLADDSTPPYAPTGLPAEPPRPLRPAGDNAVCLAVVGTTHAAPRYGLYLSMGEHVTGQRVHPRLDVTPACRPADYVRVRRSDGILATVVPSSGTARSGARYLVTDTGVRYRVGTAAATAFGYRKSAPMVLPQSVVSLLPSGPRLSPSKVTVPTKHTTSGDCVS